RITSTGTGIHGRYKHEISREGIISICAGNPDAALFQRLAQHLQDSLSEFREFIQEQYAAVRKTNLSRSRDHPSADQRRSGCRVGGRAGVRPLPRAVPPPPRPPFGTQRVHPPTRPPRPQASPPPPPPSPPPRPAPLWLPCGARCGTPCW